MDIWEEHDLVYHYTTLSGLKGILETQTLHATHFAFLNDSKELYQMEPRLVQVAQKVFLELGVNGPDALAKRVVDTLYGTNLGLDGRVIFYQPFVASFCAHTPEQKYEREHGMLSMWRSYGKDSGYAMVFDTKSLVALIEEEKVQHHYIATGMAEVVYDTSDAVFENEFDELITVMRADIPRPTKDPKMRSLNETFRRDIVRYKHRGFEEEREIRIVMSPTHDELLNVAGQHDFREQKEIKCRDSLAPYIVLFDKAKTKLPIKRIIVGPHADKERRLAKLKSYLALRDLEIDVSCSETPLV